MISEEHAALMMWGARMALYRSTLVANIAFLAAVTLFGCNQTKEYAATAPGVSPVPLRRIPWNGIDGPLFVEPVHQVLGRQIELDLYSPSNEPGVVRHPTGAASVLKKTKADILAVLTSGADEFDTVVIDAGKWIDKYIVDSTDDIESWAQSNSKHLVYIQHSSLCFDRECVEACLIR